jgi:hypothetical protein
MVVDDSEPYVGLPEELTYRGDLRDHFPESPRGGILVTTTQMEATSGLLAHGKQRPIKVGKMERHRLFLRLLQVWLNTGRVDVIFDDVWDLAFELLKLDFPPLAVVLAAAFINQSGIPVGSYLQLLDHQVNTGPVFFVDTLAQTWTVSFKPIQQENPFAAELLSLMSFFDQRAIPLAILTRYAAQKQEQQQNQELQEDQHLDVVRALKVLKSFALITEEAAGDVYTIHPLVQSVTLLWLDAHGMIRGFAESALSVMARVYPFGSSENRVMCRTYYPHVHKVLGFEGTGSRDEKLARAGLLHSAASFLADTAARDRAEELGRQAVELRKSVLGEEHRETLASMGNLALILGDQGKLEEAEILAMRVTETFGRTLGEEHPDTLHGMDVLMSTYRKQDRLDEASELGVRVLEARRRVLGEEHLETLATMGNLASLWNYQGRLGEAIDMMRQCVKLQRQYRQVHGADHPDTIDNIDRLAGWLDRKAIVDGLR